jgi:mono/diheme cytochrome c family protein
MKCVVGVVAMALLLSGCERQMHDMYGQARFDPDEGSSLWHDGRADRPPVPGTVAVATGDIAGTSSGRHAQAESTATQPPTTKSLLVRGQDRYSIYCLPCHSPVGDGDGPVARRGFPHPPTYHQPRLRNATDQYLFDVITNGHGVMYGYADRVAPQDRWAIVAYIRALQLSQNAQVAQLPAALQDKLKSEVKR